MSLKLRPFHAVVAALALSLGASFFAPEGPASLRAAVASALRPAMRASAFLPALGTARRDDAGEESPWRAAFLRERALRIAERRALGARPGERLAPKPELDALLAEERARATVVPARVIHHDVSALRSGVLLDAGTDDGVRVGAPVSVGPAVVGVVVRAFPSVCQVRLLDDPQSRLPAFAIAEMEDDAYDLRLGVLVGRGDGRLEMSSLEGEGVVAGSVIVTSTRDVRVPPYLVLGRVIEVTDTNYDGVVEVTVGAVVDFETLTDVVVWITPKLPRDGPWETLR